MPKNSQTTTQLHSSHMLVKLAFSLLRNLYAEQEATVRTYKEQLAGSKFGKQYIKAVYIVTLLV